MFKKSKHRIVITIMSILVCIFLGTLAIIYASSYLEVSRSNQKKLERHAQMHTLEEDDKEKRTNESGQEPIEPFSEGKAGEKPFEDDPAYELSTFYSVAFDKNGQVIEVDIGEHEVRDEETLTKYAEEIMQGNEKSGRKSSLIYYVMEKHGYTLVAFMDNTVIRESMSTLFRHTLLFCGIALVIIFFFAKHIAQKIVDPLEQSYMKQKQFISDAGHELKTPVSVVSANAELLQREIGESLWLSNIQYENERMGQLVEQLLELARTENVVPHMEMLDLSRLVVGGALTFESLAFEKGIVLDVQAEDDIQTMGNRTQLSQLVSILVDNAIGHSPRGKDINVQLYSTRKTVVFSVINAGDPIPKEKRALVFERFYRTDEARVSEDKHYGLGLAIAKAIVEAHHGSIEVLCEQGMIEFRVTLEKY